VQGAVGRHGEGTDGWGQAPALEDTGRDDWVWGWRQVVCYFAFTTPPTVENPVPLHESLP